MRQIYKNRSHNLTKNRIRNPIKMLQTGARDGPESILEALGPPSGILFKNAQGGPLVLEGPLGRLCPPGAPKSFRNTFWLDLLGTILNQKSEKKHPKRHQKIDTEKT